jgi:hypothetical protein
MVLLAGKKTIFVYDRQSRSRIAVICSLIGVDGTFRYHSFDWDSLHYDVRGDHLIVTSSKGNLFWTPRYSETLRASAQGATTVLVTDKRLTLCVENGRVAFVVSVGHVSLLINARGSEVEKKNTSIILELERKWQTFSKLVFASPRRPVTDKRVQETKAADHRNL